MIQPADAATSRRINSALIVDDHPLFCDALSMTLRLSAGISQIHTADRLDAALRHIADAGAPDVILLDLNLPDVTGLDGLVRLIKATDGAPVVVVSSMADNRMVGSALSAGAAGFIPKHSRREVFREAFDRISEGGVFAPAGFVPANGEEAAARSEGEEAVARLALLTRQQAKILQLICAGKLNKQIAYDLSIAETTVKAHVTAIMRKLCVQSRTQAVLIAQQARFDSLMREGETAG